MLMFKHLMNRRVVLKLISKLFALIPGISILPAINLAVKVQDGSKNYTTDENVQENIHSVNRKSEIGTNFDGIHAYGDLSIVAGNTVNFRVSADQPYRLSIFKLGSVVDNTSQDQEMSWTCEHIPLPMPQPIYPGSYVEVATNIPASQTLGALTIECWIRPWGPNKWCGLVTQHDFPNSCSLGLFLDVEGRIRFYLGNGGEYNSEGDHISSIVIDRVVPNDQDQLVLSQWYHVVGVWDGTNKSLWVRGVHDTQWQHTQWQFSSVVKGGSSPIRLGAYANNGSTTDLIYDGDLAMPVLYDRALSEVEIQARYDQMALARPSDANILACWPFDEEQGETAVDISQYERHGSIINQATWMIGGPSFNSNEVPFYGDYDPSQDAQRGHGLRFASDDLYDCNWQITNKCLVPTDAKPGIYVGRIVYGENYANRYDVTFVIKKALGKAVAPIALLCSTSTWLAYGGQNIPNGSSHSLYGDHIARQPRYKIGLRMPCPSFDPFALYGIEYGHLVRAERFLHLWLDEQNYEYDVITDFDLHNDPALLSNYKILMINGHSEYWSTSAYEGVKAFLDNGGKVIALSGNNMLWRVSFDQDGKLMECRKFAYRQDYSGGKPVALHGEKYHSQDGRRGGLMHECGYPAWKLLGLQPVGFANTNCISQYYFYRIQVADHFLFKQPEEIQISENDPFGCAFDENGKPTIPMAVSHEWDIRLGNFPEPVEVPTGAVWPVEEPPGIITLAKCVTDIKPGAIWDYFMQPVSGNVACENISEQRLISEIILWGRPQGGQIFSIGSIGAGWGLSVDRKLQALLRNVLTHFGVSPQSKLYLPTVQR